MFSRREILTASAGAWIAPALVSGAAERTAPAPLSLQRLAWAGVRLELADVTVFIDAVAPSPTPGKSGPPLVAGRGRSYALVTHHHGDHWDPKALGPVLGEKGYAVCHEETARYADTRSIRTQPTRLYEPVFLSRVGAEFVALAVPAADGLGSPQVSWIVDGGGKRLIHCGDTLWHGHWWDIARAYGPFDVAFLPINGFRDVQGRYTDEGVPMGMTPVEAAAAARVLQARVAVPIHFGSRGDPAYRETANPVEVFTAAAQAKGVAVRVVAPGEELALL